MKNIRKEHEKRLTLLSNSIENVYEATCLIQKSMSLYKKLFTRYTSEIIKDSFSEV